MAKRLIKIDLSQGPSDPGGDRRELGAPYCRFTVLSLPGPCSYRLASDPDGQFFPLAEGMEITEQATREIFFDYEKGTGEVEIAAMTEERLSPNGAGGDTDGLAPDRRLAFRSTIRSLTAAGGRNAWIEPDFLIRDVTRSNGGNIYTVSHAYADSAGSELSGFLQECPANINDDCRAVQDIDGWYPSLGWYLSPHGFSLPDQQDHYHYIRTSALLQHSALAGPAEVFIGFGNYRRAFNNTTSAIGFFADPGAGETLWKAGVHFQDAGGTARFFVEESLAGYPFKDAIYDLEVRVGVEGGSPYIRWRIDGEQVHERSLPFSDTFYDDQATLPRIYTERKTGNSSDWLQLWTHLHGFWEGGTVYV